MFMRFGLIAGAAVASAPALAQGVPQSEWPASVRAEAQEQAAYCRDSGGAPSATPESVLRADFNQDGRPDYVVTMFGCEGVGFGMYGYNAGGPASIHLSGPRGYTKAWDGMALDSSLILGPPDILTVDYRCEGTSGMTPNSFCGAELVYANGRIVQRNRWQGEPPAMWGTGSTGWARDPASRGAVITLRSSARPLQQAWVGCEGGQPVLSFRYRDGQAPRGSQASVRIADENSQPHRFRLARDGDSATWSARPAPRDILAILTGRLGQVYVVDRTDAGGNDSGFDLPLTGSTNAIGAVLRACAAGGTTGAPPPASVSAPAAPPPPAEPRPGTYGAWMVARSADGAYFAHSLTRTAQIESLGVGCRPNGPSLAVLLPRYRGRPPVIGLATPSARLDVPMAARGEGWMSATGDARIAELLTSGPYVDVAVNGRGAGRISLDGAADALGGTLASCWRPAGAAPVAGSAPVAASDEAQARAFVASLYDRYMRDPGSGDDEEEEVFSPGLAALVARASDGEVGLGYDPFCECQDYDDVRYSIQALSVRGNNADARIAFSSFGESRTIALRLVKTPSGWKVDDILGADGRSLRATLTRSPGRR